MDGWIRFWTIARLVGFSAFGVLVVVIVPLGGRDLLRLFRHLDRGSERGEESPPPGE
jgi:hypothetical protein